MFVSVGGNDAHLQKLNEHKLIETYSNVKKFANNDSIAIPALGCGVKGWRPHTSAKIARSVFEGYKGEVIWGFREENVKRIWEEVFEG